MERFKSTIIILLLVFGLLTETVQAKSATILLQEGIYAEETEGDLEKAISLYEQVLEQYKDVERLAARATYQLGMCYLKKGDKEKAAEYFDEVASYYSEQISVVKKAQKQLDKIVPAQEVIARSSVPFVIDTSPETYANNVAPEIGKISVTFDRTMTDRSWAWVKWDYPYPETVGSPYYDATKTTCTLPVKLEAGKAYFISINSEPYTSFMSADGVSAQPYVLVFATKDEKGNATPIPKDMLAKAKEINAIKPAQPYTQEMHNEIAPNGLIHFKSPHNHTNNTAEPIKTTGFINSDFVNVTGMYYKDGQPVKYTTTHEGNHFRYNITLDKPILPGETIEGTVEGTITGLIKPVAEMPDTYQYYMNHSPSTDVPTLRIETYLLPKGAEVISTSPGMRKTEKNGRTELAVEKIIPVGGSLLTTFQYKLTGAELASAKPLKLDPAPWVDGEVMRLSINTMTGMEIGTLGYIARLVDINGKQGWSIRGYQIIMANNSRQYTQVDAELDSFVPITGRTKNDEGDFIANYEADGINLTSVLAHGMEKTQNIKPEHIVYDNEQVLYLLRRLPLKEGFQTKFKIFSIQTGAIVDCQINVTGKETVTAPAGTFDCYKTMLAIYSGTIKALEHKLWFSADNNRYVVKYDSGAAIMELIETGIRQAGQKQLVTDEQAGLSLTLPADWCLYKNPSPSPYALSWYLLPPESEAWALLTGAQRISAFDSARTVAYMDIEVLKGFFKDYTPRENSWSDLTIDGVTAVSYEADYVDKGGPMVEYRTYILGKSQVYWFVFRVEKEKFKENKAEFDSIIESFKINAN